MKIYNVQICKKRCSSTPNVKENAFPVAWLNRHHLEELVNTESDYEHETMKTESDYEHETIDY